MSDFSDPQGGVSPTIKVFVIGLTVITFIAFCVFMYLLISKIFSLSQGATWDKQLIQIGDRLKNEGLQEEAIAQYEKFLEGPKIDPSLRAKVSHSIGRLYQEKGNCRQALVWFFQVELAHPQTAREKNLGAQIDFCLQQIKSSAGDELN